MQTLIDLFGAGIALTLVSIGGALTFIATIFVTGTIQDRLTDRRSRKSKRSPQQHVGENDHG